MMVVIVSFAARMPTILEPRQEFGTPQPRMPCATDQATPAAAAIMMKIASQRPILRPGSSSGWFAGPLWRADDEVNISERYAPDTLEARTCITNYENTGARDPRAVPRADIGPTLSLMRRRSRRLPEACSAQALPSSLFG
jgi:hypothetical protein